MSDMPSAGRLEDRPFAGLAGLIFRGGLGGELTVTDVDRVRRVWFLGGNPVAVVSDDPQDHVAQVLLEHGKVGDEEAGRLAELPETREGLAEAEGFIPREVLSWGVKVRFVNLCYDLFRWEGGDYSFREAPPPRDLFLLKVPANSLILKGVGFMGRAIVQDAVPDDAQLGAGPVDAGKALWLGADERRLLAECLRARTVGDVLAGRGEDAEPARRSVYALACLGLLSISPAVVERPVGVPSPEEPAPEEPFLEEPAPEEPFLEEPTPEEPAIEEPAPETPAPPPAFTTPGLEMPAADLPEGAPPRPPSEEAPWDRPAPRDFSFEDHGPVGETPPAGDVGLDEQPPPALGGDLFGAPTGESSPGTGGALGADLGFDGPADQEEEEPEPEPEAPRRGVALPRIALIAGGAILAAGILGGGLWWYLGTGDRAPGSTPPPIATVAVPRPELAETREGAGAAPAAEPLEPSPVPPAEPPAVQIAEAGPAPPAIAPPPTPPVAAPPPAPTPAPAPPEASPPPPPSAAPSGASDRYRTGLQVFGDGDVEGAAAIWESELEEVAGSMTVLLMTACQRETLHSAFTALAGHGPLFLVGKDVQGRRCYRVALGTFDSRTDASRALSALPAEYREAGAAVRRVSEVLAR